MIDLNKEAEAAINIIDRMTLVMEDVNQPSNLRYEAAVYIDIAYEILSDVEKMRKISP